MLEKIKVDKAIGMKICHDMTRVVPGEFKGAEFKRGHVICEEDIPRLRAMGKENIYIGELPEGCLHEDECAVRVARAICDCKEFQFTDVSEGKINIKANYDGVLKVNKELLYRINSIEHMAVCTIYDDVVVKKNQVVASERIIPLYTEEKNILELERLCREEKVFKVNKFNNLKVHIIVTGSEVYKGIIQDKFSPVLERKAEKYGCTVIKIVKAPDDKAEIERQIDISLKEGADIILCTGGMSVDEDDITPIAIKEKLDRLVVHGTPVQPGNMFLLGYSGNTAIMGLPGAVMYYEATIFDVVFPKLVSSWGKEKELEELNKDFFVRLSLGGLCQFCGHCSYPNCTFCKGK